MHTVDSYTATESAKTRIIARLLVSSGENKSLDLTVIGSINTCITKRKNSQKTHIEVHKRQQFLT